MMTTTTVKRVDLMRDGKGGGGTQPRRGNAGIISMSTQPVIISGSRQGVWEFPGDTSGINIVHCLNWGILQTIGVRLGMAE